MARNQAAIFGRSLPRKYVITAFAAFFISGLALADEPTDSGSDYPTFSFKGFGTVGVVHNSEHQADFVTSDLMPHGAGYTKQWSPNVDSKLGAQLSAQFNPHWSALLQVTSAERADATFKPEVEWGNIKYQFNPDVSVTVGRTVLPSFLVSDSRLVGYSNPWVRPPVEVYSLVPLTRADGISTSYRARLGEVSNTLLVNYGEANTTDGAGYEVKAKNAWMLSDTVEYGAATLHAAYQQSRLTIGSYKTLFDYYRSPLFGSAGQALADKYDPNDTLLKFMSLGASYDPGKWFVMAEWGQTDTSSVYGKRAGWYATGGYRIGSWTPYVTYAQAQLKSNSSDPGLSANPAYLASLPNGYYRAVAAGTAAAVNANLNDQLSAAPVQKTISVGVRWDFAKNAAFKLQYDHTDVGAGSRGALSNNSAPGYTPGAEFSLISATIDFVF
jgi:predicted porin